MKNKFLNVLNKIKLGARAISFDYLIAMTLLHTLQVFDIVPKEDRSYSISAWALELTFSMVVLYFLGGIGEIRKLRDESRKGKSDEV